MRRMALSLIAAAMAFVVSSNTSAYGCSPSIPQPTLQEQIRNADTIFTGKIHDISYEKSEASVFVSRVFKGEVWVMTVVKVPLSGSLCGFDLKQWDELTFYAQKVPQDLCTPQIMVYPPPGAQFKTSLLTGTHRGPLTLREKRRLGKGHIPSGMNY